MQSEEDREELRLKKVQEYHVLDKPREEAFDRITRLVSALLDVPIAAVTLIDRDRQWFKAEKGLDLAETPREQSFCAHAMQGTGPMVVNDATLDPRFASNPLVTGRPDIRFYVGVPLRAPDGTPLGALCGIDTRPRQIAPRELEILGDLANLTMEQLELRLLATRDGLTGCMRRAHFLASAAQDFALARRRGAPLSCLMIDADHFKRINDQWGHPIGDAVLVSLADAIRSELRRSDTLGRMGGEEFCVFLPDTDLDGARVVAERVRQTISERQIETGDSAVHVTASIGIATLEADDQSPENLIERADAALYAAKHAGRNRIAA